MSNVNIFELASRKKLTFATTRGQLTVDQLWDLQLKNSNLSLNSIAVALKKKIAQTEDSVDLVDGDSTDLEENRKRADDKLRLEVVMHIINVLKAERDARQDRESKLSQLRAIDMALAEKQQEALVSGSVEDLQKRREAIMAEMKDNA